MVEVYDRLRMYIYFMNVHPLLVHFPIAFFTTYSLFELARFKVVTKQSYWFYIKAILLFLGVISALAAITAGKIIESQFSDKALVSLHKHVNETATILFAILAYAYLISWLKQMKY